MSDDVSQETQLRGKQLVFLGMSVTVVAVVIFLCGVMVGRGVPTARQALAVPIEADPATDATAVDPADPDLVPPPSESGSGAAPLEYPVIVSDDPGADSLIQTADAPRQPFAAETTAKSAPVGRAESAPARSAEKATPAPAPPAPRADPTAATGGSGAGGSPERGGFLVQVAAYQREGDATTVSDRLKRKGYPAFVTTATTPAGTWFRVRVGSFTTRAEAQDMAMRLKRDEQLEPWVTR